MKIGNSVSRQDLEQFFDECDPRIAVSAFTHNAAHTEARFQPEELKSFFSDLDFRVEIQSATKRQLDRRLASDFSAFGYIEPDENRLSDILAMLLDPRGAHGQQDLFLKLFMHRLLGRSSEPSLHEAKVIREALTHTISNYLRRVDILVATGGFALAIENKVDSGEQEDQLKAYHEHVQRLVGEDYCLVFLTPDGRKSRSVSEETATRLRCRKRLFELSYARIRDWLQECRRWCEAEKIRYFLADFIHYIETHPLCQEL